MTQIRLTHKPLEMARKDVRKPLRGVQFICFLKDRQSELRQLRRAEGRQVELQLEKACNILVILQEFTHLVQQAAQDHYWSAFRSTHAREELVQLIYIRSLVRRQELLCVGNQQDTILERRDILVKLLAEIAPVSGVNLLRRHLHDSGIHHLAGDDVRDESLAGSTVSQDEAVHADLRAIAGKALGHDEFPVEFLQQRDDVVLADQALLGGRFYLQPLAAEATVFRFRTVIFPALFTDHDYSLFCCSASRAASAASRLMVCIVSLSACPVASRPLAFWNADTAACVPRP